MAAADSPDTLHAKIKPPARIYWRSKPWIQRLVMWNTKGWWWRAHQDGHLPIFSRALQQLATFLWSQVKPSGLSGSHGRDRHGYFNPIPSSGSWTYPIWLFKRLRFVSVVEKLLITLMADRIMGASSTKDSNHMVYTRSGVSHNKRVTTKRKKIFFFWFNVYSFSSFLHLFEKRHSTANLFQISLST